MARQKNLITGTFEKIWPRIQEPDTYQSCSPYSQTDKVSNLKRMIENGCYDAASALLKAKEFGFEEEIAEVLKKCFANDSKKWLIALRKNELSKTDKPYAVAFILKAIKDGSTGFAELGTSEKELLVFIGCNQIGGVRSKGPNSHKK